MSKRSNIYIDGFNFYYGAVKDTPYKWLDMETLFKRLRNSDNIQNIFYFTALVNPPAQARQELYLRALATCPLVTVIQGKFKNRKVRCSVRSCNFTGDKLFQVPEEKRTDVNIAVRIVQDAFENNCDTFVIVSGDSDLVPALRTVKEKFPEKTIIVYVPTRNPIRGAAVEIRAAADKARDFPLELLSKCQFPRSIPDGFGGLLDKPRGW